MKNKNIIIVMTDQQRADLRKSRGYDIDTMPFLDQWSQGGIDFEGAYTANPTCMPARVSMYTGRYPSAHLVRSNHNRDDIVSDGGLLELLKEHGYKTALCGKNHSHYADEDFDFSETNGHLGSEGNWHKGRATDEFTEFLDKSKHMESHIPTPGGLESQHPYRNVSAALKFIDQNNKEQPFYIWLSFAEPHNPFQVPEPYFDMFPPESLSEIVSEGIDLSTKGNKFTWTREIWDEIYGDERKERLLRSRSNYLGMLRLIDDQFKRLIQGLEERKIADNTLVVFLSDHGDFVGEYGMMRKGTDLPDVLCRIPMIWRGPGVVSSGVNREHFVNIVDIYPTICDLLGVDVPVGVQGKSIRPILENKDIPDNEFDIAYAENGFGGLYWTKDDELTPEEEGACDDPKDLGHYTEFDCLNTWTQCGQVRMIRKGKYKLQMDMMGNGYLYDLENDPFEICDLYGSVDHVRVQSDMQRELIAAILKAQDPLPLPRRRYHYKKDRRGYWHL